MYRTTYDKAIHFCHNHYILCNNIDRIDSTIFDNARFDWYDENDNPREIYQYFIASCSDGDVEFLEKHFPSLLFTYSEVLDLYILCVDHWGTSWEGVGVDTDLEYFRDNQYRD